MTAKIFYVKNANGGPHELLTPERKMLGTADLDSMGDETSPHKQNYIFFISTADMVQKKSCLGTHFRVVGQQG